MDGDVMPVENPSQCQAASAMLERLFAECERVQGSDIHVAAGSAPRLRVQGALRPLDGFPVAEPALCEAIGICLGRTSVPADVADPAAAVHALLAKAGSVDGAVTSPGGSRYRFNVFRENGQVAAALRRLDDNFHSLRDLGLPEALADFCDCRDGLVIVTGPTGSGKSTTLATLVDQINRTREGHVITIEDPVEYIHQSRKCLVNQRQIGRDAPGFNTALVDALREDPDVILVGEIRELDTIRTAITAAETGHLVFTTLHSGDSAGAIERLVSVFPAGEQDGIRHQLAMVLRGIFAQHLLPSATGGRRVPAYELLLVNPAVANLISTGRSRQIYSAMETGTGQGMITLDQCLAGLVAGGRVSERVASALSRNPETLRNRVLSAGAAGRGL